MSDGKNTTKSEESCNFHVIGVGASAGGLEAIENLFEAMPDDTGAAFVVVQHLSPDFKSHMEELLARKTAMTIRRVVNKMPVEPDTIYLIPPNTEMVIVNGQLLLTERDRKETLNLPIDHFFRSLANDIGKLSIGIILSGTGSDGSRGIVDIRDAGGLILCQDEDTAKFDGMPLSAQETGAVHLVLPPEQMATAISTYIEQNLTPQVLAEQEISTGIAGGLEEIFRLLRREYNIDFSLYKPTTVKRRIERRISLGSFISLENYARILGEEPEELNLLYKDLLIGVTQFFRDARAFDFLKSEIIPRIIQDKAKSGDSIRIWVAGCATGEEAYSIAISIFELLENMAHPPNVKIFATDVHRQSLQTASIGVYPEESFGEVSAERLAKYFIKRPDGYEILAEIRKMIVFAPQDVINDAPFTKLDLVTCRNLLIYLQPVVQKKVISLFHFSLRTGGFMFLGPSETPGDLREEFDAENKKWRIYRKRRDIRLTSNIKLPLGGINMTRPFTKPGRGSRPTPEAQMLATYDMLLDRCMSPSFLVDERGELVHSFGGAERFLQFRGGRVSTNIVEIIHEDLKTSVSGALQHVSKENKTVRYTGISIKTKSGMEQVRLIVEPILDPRTEISHTLVTIEPLEEKLAETAPQLDEDIDVSEMARDHIATLENELRYTKENLQATVEELETANEELQATNEELVASNEEMQSTNEELQSVNEELYTVNHEYQRKIVELTELSDDMNNLFKLTDVGVVFLDPELNIRRFTPRAADTFKLMSQDVGRPFENFAHNILDEQVFKDVSQVLDQETTLQRELRDRRNNHWLLKIMPYRTKTQVEGVVLTLVDINSIKETDAQLREYQKIVESTVEAIISTDLEGRITSWNQGAVLFYGYSIEEALGQHISMLVPPKRQNEVHEIFDQVTAGEAIKSLRTERLTKHGDVLNVVLTVSPIYDMDKSIVGVSSISHDYTQQKKAEEEEKKLAAIVNSSSDFVGSCDLKGNTLMINPAGRAMLGLAEDFEVLGKPITDWHSPEMTQFIKQEAMPTAIREGQWKGKTSIVNRDGKEIPLSSVIIAHKDEFGNVEYLSMIARDITQELEFERQLLDREKFLRRTLDGLAAFAGVLLPDGTLIEANKTALESANLKPGDVLGRPFADTHWWTYSPRIQQQLRQAIQSAAQGNRVRYDVPVRLADNQLITIDFQITPLKNDGGEITHLIVSGIDITERVELESRSRVFRHAFDSSLTAIVITNPKMADNPITYVNPGFEKLTGFTANEAVGKNCRFLQGPETDPATIDKLRRAIRAGRSCQAKLLNYRKDGSTFWNELVITPVRDEQGSLTHFVGVQFDMTEHQKSALNLSQARDIAEAANHAKSAFVANMSHEIRTPLTTIVGMTEMLLDQETDKSKYDTLQMIHQSGKHLVTLVSDVLDMSKIEAGKLEANLTDVSPVQIIDDVAASMSYRAKEKGLNFRLEYQGMLPELIRTDPVRLRQVLFNLTGNAVKFTDQGSITLRCRLIDRDHKPKLQIEVTDTGVGFEPGQVERLFEQFSQVDNSPTRRQGGTGLGLYISKRIIELLGGSLHTESVLGQGSTFTVSIPTGALADRTMIDPTAKKDTQSQRDDLAAGSDMELDARILVVEDTRGIQRLLSRMLENAGATVEVANDGQDAIDRYFVDANPAGEAPFDLILLDMHMPRLSGYDTAAQLRKDGFKLPIIALTASAMKGDRERCLNAGCDDYVTKPIDRHELLTKISQQLNRSVAASAGQVERQT